MADRRQLTVVMFADIVGYTALMQHNEDEALRLLDRFKEELELTIKECQGEIVQFYGDGCLAVFHNHVMPLPALKLPCFSARSLIRRHANTPADKGEPL